MQNYLVHLSSPVFDTFRCQKAANSVDLDVRKKSEHILQIEADLATAFNVGVIVGASGSGKTTLCHSIFGNDCFFDTIDLTQPIIEQFPESYSYDDCVNILTGVGLSQVPCWIRPVSTLSNGQRARALAALAIAQNSSTIVLDEWTSVVDRTVAKAMSHCVQKQIRRSNKSIILCSCHYDVIEWLAPDWVIDCNAQTFTNTR